MYESAGPVASKSRRIAIGADQPRSAALRGSGPGNRADQQFLPSEYPAKLDPGFLAVDHEVTSPSIPRAFMRPPRFLFSDRRRARGKGTALAPGINTSQGEDPGDK